MGFVVPLIIKDSREGEGVLHGVGVGCGAAAVDRDVLTPDLTHIHTHLSSGINSRRPHTGAVLNSVVFLFEHFVDDT